MSSFALWRSRYHIVAKAVLYGMAVDALEPDEGDESLSDSP
jgi:hypothetical protein